MPNSFSKNNCKAHAKTKLVHIQDCPVEFVYIFPHFHNHHKIIEDGIRGVIRCSVNVTPKNNLHNHTIAINGSLSHKIPKKVSSDLEKTTEDNPCLTTRQIASGQGLGYRPCSADIAGNSYGRLYYHRKKALKECGLSSKEIHVVSEMEKIANKIDLKDSQIECSTMILKR